MSDAQRAKVTTASPLTVTPLGSTVAVPAFTLGYTPVINDIVAYVTLDRRALLVLGKIT